MGIPEKDLCIVLSSQLLQANSLDGRHFWKFHLSNARTIGQDLLGHQQWSRRELKKFKHLLPKNKLQWVIGNSKPQTLLVEGEEGGEIIIIKQQDQQQTMYPNPTVTPPQVVKLASPAIATQLLSSARKYQVQLLADLRPENGMSKHMVSILPNADQIRECHGLHRESIWSLKGNTLITFFISLQVLSEQSEQVSAFSHFSTSGGRSQQLLVSASQI